MTMKEAVEVIKTAQSQVEWDYPMDYAAAFDLAIKALKKQETPAVPLDKLCEWLATENVMIPCRACNHFENGQCGVVNDMKTPCPSGADEWRKVLEKREWKNRP